MNRARMMHAVVKGVREAPKVREFDAELMAVNCHHNYVTKETHYGEKVFVTRKGAVRAGKGNEESFCSCSHGAGRIMSRRQAKKQFSVEDHRKATKGVECRKDKNVIDETPGAYKDIDSVMKAQSDLVEVVHTLKQIVCVKG